MIDSKYWLTSSAGIKMPPLIYGTAWKKEETANYVATALENGFRGIDTAGQPRHYNEGQVGEALQKVRSMGIQREELYIQTKFTPLPGQDPNNTPYDKSAPLEKQIEQSLQSSLTNLQTPYLDSYLLHSPLSPFSDLMRAWNTMEQFYESGQVKQLGISNCYSLELLKSLFTKSNIKPAVIQNRFYRDTGYDASLREWCSGHSILYQSFWTLTANPHILASSLIESLTTTYQKTPPQIFFRFLNQSEIVPLTGTTSEQHMKEDLAIFEFELSSEEIGQIKQLLEF